MTDTTFLVEHYLPGRQPADLETFARSIQASEAVRVLQTTVIPDDESVLCVIAAPSEQAVRAAYARAGIHFDRISTAIAHTDNPKGGSNVK
jgi:hypothetical protein